MASKNYYSRQEAIDDATMRIDNPNMVGSGYIQFPPQRPFETPLTLQPPTISHIDHPDEWTGAAPIGVGAGAAGAAGAAGVKPAAAAAPQRPAAAVGGYSQAPGSAYGQVTTGNLYGRPAAAPAAPVQNQYTSASSYMPQATQQSNMYSQQMGMAGYGTPQPMGYGSYGAPAGYGTYQQPYQQQQQQQAPRPYGVPGQQYGMQQQQQQATQMPQQSTYMPQMQVQQQAVAPAPAAVPPPVQQQPPMRPPVAAPVVRPPVQQQAAPVRPPVQQPAIRPAPAPTPAPAPARRLPGAVVAPPPPPPSSVPKASANEWSCPSCTFLNSINNRRCDMCNQPQPAAAKGAVTLADKIAEGAVLSKSQKKRERKKNRDTGGL